MNMKRYLKDARSDLLTYAGVIIAFIIGTAVDKAHQLANRVDFHCIS